MLPKNEKRLALEGIIRNEDTGEFDIWAKDTLYQSFYGVSIKDPEKITQTPKFGSENLQKELEQRELPYDEAKIKEIKLISLDMLKKFAKAASEIIQAEGNDTKVTAFALLTHENVRNILPITFPR